MLNELKIIVHNLWKVLVELRCVVVKHVHNFSFIPSLEDTSFSYTQVILANCTAFMNSKNTGIAPVRINLSTLSTKPITTTYIYKIGRHLVSKPGAVT